MNGLYGIIRRELKKQSKLPEKYNYEDPILDKPANLMYYRNYRTMDSFALIDMEPDSLLDTDATYGIEYVPAVLNINGAVELEATIKAKISRATNANAFIGVVFSNGVGYSLSRCGSCIDVAKANTANRIGGVRSLLRSQENKITGNIFLKIKYNYSTQALSFLYSTDETTWNTHYSMTIAAVPVTCRVMNNNSGTTTIYAKDISLKVDGVWLYKH